MEIMIYGKIHNFPTEPADMESAAEVVSLIQN